MPMLQLHYSSSQYKTKLFDYRRAKEQHKSSALHSFSMSFKHEFIYSKNKQGSLGLQRRYMFSLLDYVEFGLFKTKFLIWHSSSTYSLSKPKYVFQNFTLSANLAFKKLLIAQTLKWPVEVYPKNYFLPFRTHNFPSLLSFESEKSELFSIKGIFIGLTVIIICSLAIYGIFVKNDLPSVTVTVVKPLIMGLKPLVDRVKVAKTTEDILEKVGEKAGKRALQWLLKKILTRH